MTNPTPSTAESPARLNGTALYLRLLRYVQPYWRIFAASILCSVIVAGTETAMPAILKPMLDGSFVKRDPTYIALIPVWLSSLVLLRSTFTFASSYTTNWVATKLVTDLRNLMFQKLIHMPTSYFENISSGAVIANIAFNVTQVTAAATNVITVLVRDSFTVLGLLGLMFYLDWKLSLITLIVAPLVAMTVRLFSKRLRHTSHSSQHAMGDVTHVLQEALSGYKVMKIFGGEKYEAARLDSANNRLRRFNIKQNAAGALHISLVQIIAGSALVVIVSIATHHSSSDQITVGGFVSFIAAMFMLLSPIKRLTGINEELQRGLAAAEVVFDLLDREAEIDQGKVALGHSQGRIELQQVTLQYEADSRPALQDVSLDIKPGESVALVGQSGSGKTSLVNLIPRFYHASQGKLLIDGHDVMDIQLACLRDNIAFVSQDVVLFNDTIAANIAYGRQAQSSLEEITAAAEAAHAMEFIRDMPQGLQTMVGENGVKLSGGQRQRLAIARAILKNAPILILDEATSALDTQSERHVQAALETLMRERTTIIIAHRLSTVEKADRIVVMQQGRIVEQGNHQALLQQNGIYANLYRTQFAGA